MSTDVLLPKPGFSMNEAKLVEWLLTDDGEVVYPVATTLAVIE